MPYRSSSDAFLTNFDCPYGKQEGRRLLRYNNNNNNNNHNNSNHNNNISSKSSNNGDYIGSGVTGFAGGFAPMRRSVSCTSCLLCGSSSPRPRDIDDVLLHEVGGVGMKKVASCSMCNWDVDESIKSSDDGDFVLNGGGRLTSDELGEVGDDNGDDSTTSSTDDVSLDDTTSTAFQPFGDTTLENDDTEGEEEGYSIRACALRRDNYYATQFIEPDDNDTTDSATTQINDNTGKHDDDGGLFIDTCLSRTSPDGGECDDAMSDYDEKTRHGDIFDVKRCPTSENTTDTDTDDEKNKRHSPLTSSCRKNGNTTTTTTTPRKHPKKPPKPKKCISLDKIASEELDEIFGRIQRNKTTVYESDADSEHNFIFRPLSKTKKGGKRRTKMKKYRSVEDISTECVLPPGVLSRSQSSLDFSKLLQISGGGEGAKELLAMDENGLNQRWVEYLQTIDGLKAFVG